MRGFYDYSELRAAASAPIMKKIISNGFYFIIVLFLFHFFIYQSIFYDIPIEEQKPFHGYIFAYSVALGAVMIYLCYAILYPMKMLVETVLENENFEPMEIPFDAPMEVRVLYNKFNETILNIQSLQHEALSKERDQATKETLQMLAHDIREPFSYLNNLVSLIDQTTNQEEKEQIIKKFLPLISKKNDDVLHMLEDIMHFGIDHIKKQESFCLKIIIAEIIDELCKKNSFNKNNIQINLNHSTELSLDPLKLKRVLVNIFSNAMQAMNENDCLWVHSIENKDQSISLRIGNTGSQIDKQNIENIFKPFYTHGKAQGTGLGLAICQKLMKEMQGQIYCFSLEDEVMFFLTLPKKSVS